MKGAPVISDRSARNLAGTTRSGRNVRATLRRCWPCAVLLLLFPLCAQCQQPKFDVSVNYSFLHANPNGNGTPFNSNGGSVSLAWNLKPHLAVIGDFGGYRFGGQPIAVDGQLYTYAFGAQFSREHADRRWTPFARIMAGGAHVSGEVSSISAAENGFSMIAGGGLDVAWRSRVSIRVGEVDYLLTRFNRVTATNGIQNDLRISAGITFHLPYRQCPTSH